MLKVIDRAVLDAVSTQAKESPRLRKNYNLHRADDAPCHRLLNAIEPGSYIRPHRHLDPAKDETIVVLRGRLGVIIFNNDGSIKEKTLLTAGGDAIAADVTFGTFHTFISLDSGTIFFETKAGPYRPITEEEFALWAPAEGSTEAMGYLDTLNTLW